MVRLAVYRPFRFAVAVALLLSMAMPLVTYACDLTGVIETPMTMEDRADMTESSDADCPCEGMMEDMCKPRAADCAAVVSCHGDAYDSDACCSSHPELEDAVSPSKQFVHLQPAVVGIVVDQAVQLQVDAPNPRPVRERAPPLAVPIHVLHSSLLL